MRGGGGGLTADEHVKNNLPDALARWLQRGGEELEREPTEQSFCVAKVDIAANDYDLSINRYKQVVYTEIDYPQPSEIIDELTTLENQILAGIKALKTILL